MNKDDLIDHFRPSPGYWFVPKMFGIGATPVTWQGWALTIGFSVLLVLDIRFMPETIARIGVGVALAVLFLVICIRKTEGGWRWHWGGTQMIRAFAAAVVLLTTFPVFAAAPTASVEVTAPGPQGPLAGTLLDPDPRLPLVIMIPGSGPTDRDGNNPAGVAGGPYRQLAEALAAKGVASLRIDKRGLFGSRAAVADPNAATTGGYADDALAWSKVVRARTGRTCVWLLGHSEGGLVALVAAQRPEGLCGLILVSTGGRPLGAVLRDQLKAAADPAFLQAGLATLDALEAGKRVPSASLPGGLQRLFADQLQGYWIDLLSHDPAKLIVGVKLPVLILQGTRDIQVSVGDAEALKKAQPRAMLTLLPDINHVLRPVTVDDRAANIATYRDATLPISPAVATAVAVFVKR